MEKKVVFDTVVIGGGVVGGLLLRELTILHQKRMPCRERRGRLYDGEDKKVRPTLPVRVGDVLVKEIASGCDLIATATVTKENL